ncbi:MAG: alpha/beta hydrolase [Anaerolineae bacterium]|jgi:pimeloyl-ACP methyl ester carboxylesterase
MWIIYLLAGVLVLIGGGLIFWLARPTHTPPIRSSQGQPLPGSIAQTERLQIGGVQQWVAIRGRDRSNPVILYLHGGPGTPETAWLHHYNANLEDHFVVVAWEQRGAGKSYAADIPPESMTLESFIADAHELTQILKKRFHVPKIYLVGHSWGACLGLLTAARYAQDYYAYVAVSQPVCLADNEEVSYQWVLDTAIARGNHKAVRQLQAIGRPQQGRYSQGFQAVATKGKWIRALGGTLYGRNALPVLLGVLLRSPIYNGLDLFSYIRGEQLTVRHLWSSIEALDLRQSSQLELPLYLFHGKGDYQAIYPLAKTWFDAVQAPRKEIVALDRVAHGALFEAPDRFLELMLQVRAETYPEP